MADIENLFENGDKTVELIRVCSLYELPPGSRKVMRLASGSILVLNIEGEFFAVSNICPHAGGYLEYGYMEGYTLECPLHYWPFDVRDGNLVGMNQPSLLDYQLELYSVFVEEGQIYLKIKAEG